MADLQSNLDTQPITLIPLEEYEPIAKQAVQKLAGFAKDAKDYKTLREALGLDRYQLPST